MTKMPGGFWVILLIGVGFFAGCGGGSDTNSNVSNRASRTASDNSPKTNAEELGLLVKLPYETEDIVWKQYPSAKRILAILRFSPANANRIVAEAGGNSVAKTIQVETWFPEELIAQGEMSGGNALKGISYPATAFFQEPYLSGDITRVDGTDNFVLDLTAK